MGDLKNVIGYLCKYLNLTFDLYDEFKPEYLRSAKFDEGEHEIIKRYWSLLDRFRNILTTTPNKYSLVTNVKLFFASINYLSVDFYALPEDMHHGSRELLIALAWLLVERNEFESIVETKIIQSSLGNEFPKLKSNTKCFNKPNLTNTSDILNFITFLTGKINNNFKVTKETDSLIIANMRKLHSATYKYDLDIQHLSVNDIYLLKNPEALNRVLSEHEYIFSLLEIKNKWESCQGIFWKWMDTVLDEKIKSKTRNDLNMDSIVNFLNILNNEAKCKQNEMKSSSLEFPISSINIPVNNFHGVNINRHILHRPKVHQTASQSSPIPETVQKKNIACEKMVLKQNELEQQVLFKKNSSDKSMIDVYNKLQSLLSKYKLNSY